MDRSLSAGLLVLLQFTGAAFSASRFSMGQEDRAAQSPAARAAKRGDVAYSKADFDGAESAYRLALSADPSYARAVWGLGRIAQLNFRRGSARDYFAAAFRLDPRDPEIIRSYVSVVPDRDARNVLLKNYLAVAGEDWESVLVQL